MADTGTLTQWRGNQRGDFTSPEFHIPPYDRAVLSWRASGPAKFEIEAAGKWRAMAEWGSASRGFRSDAVEVDMLKLNAPARKFRFRILADFDTAVTFLSVAHWRHGDRDEFSAQRSAAWGQALDVPCRSQYVEAKDPADICSPTSVAMVLDFYGVKKTTRQVADAVFDHEHKIYGNWSLNTSFVNSLAGLESYAKRGMNLADIESEILAGRPVIISHRWKEGDLDGAPIPRSNGHLIVVAGFTENGDVIVNDPAGKNDAVRRVYKRRQIYTTWLERGSGIMYVITKN